MAHELAGKTVKLRESPQWEEGADFTVEDTAVAVFGEKRGGMLEMVQGWDGHSGDTLYGKIGGIGYVANTSQIITE